MANPIGSTQEIAGTPGATVTLTIQSDVMHILATWTAGQAETVNISGTQRPEQMLTLMITNDAIARTITLGTGITSTGVIIGTGLKTAIAVFQSNGTTFHELSRTLGL